MAGPDLNVATVAYQTAKSMGASDKVMLALFEAGLVESGFQNLNHGDRDSLGFLQQRPSQGWGTPAQVRDPAYATRKFVTEAMRIEGRFATAGQLAQGVQRSAFPLRYDQRKSEATALIARVSGAAPVTETPTAPVANMGGSGGIVGAVNLLTDPHTWFRVGMLVAGAALILTALALLGWNNAPESVKTVAKAVVMKKVPLK